VAAVRDERVPVIKRFTGGGTVLVDPDTVFVTLIMQAGAPGPPMPPPLPPPWLPPKASHLTCTASRMRWQRRVHGYDHRLRHPWYPGLLPQSKQLPDVDPFPAPIMRWSEGFYAPVFSPHGDFKLRQHGERTPEEHRAQAWHRGGVARRLHA